MGKGRSVHGASAPSIGRRWLNSTDENIVRNFTHDGYSQNGRRLPLDAEDDD
jgi:hypothetical protein